MSAMDDMKVGSIVGLKLYNFMTYKQMEIHPGQGFNVVLGPNGSGKSTIVCAITVGLGGNLASHNRQKDLSDLINTDTNENEAKIVINLKGAAGEDEIVIETRIKRSNEAVFKVNDKRSSQQKVKKLVDDLQIQTENLCQFLPQDVVRNFPEMSEQNVFESTVRAVGQRELLSKYDELVALQRDNDSLRERMVMKESTLKDISKRVKEGNKIREIFDEKQKVEKLIAVHEECKKWNEFDEVRQTSRILRDEEELAEKKVKEEKEKLSVLDEELKTYNEEYKKIEDEIKKNETFMREFQKTMKHSEPDQLESEIDILNDRIESYDLTLVERKKKKKSTIQEISQLKERIRSIDEAALNKQLEERKAARRKAEEEVMRVKFDIEEKDKELRRNNDHIQLKQRDLSKCSTEEHKRLNVLRKFNSDAYKGVMWLKENRHLFKAPVHDPIMLTIKMHDRSNAIYLEKSVGWQELEAFVCEDVNDMNKLIHELRKVNGLTKINVIHSSPDGIMTPPHDPSSLRQFGFKAFLIDTFDAPAAVKAHLCKKCQLHAIPVFDEDFDPTANGHGQFNFRRYFVKKKMFNVRRSNYGNKNTTVSIENIEFDSVQYVDSQGTDEGITTLKEAIEGHKIVINLKNTPRSTGLGLSNCTHELKRNRGDLMQKRKETLEEKKVLDAKLEERIAAVKDVENQLYSLKELKLDKSKKEEFLKAIDSGEDPTKEKESDMKKRTLLAGKLLKATEELQARMRQVTEYFTRNELLSLELEQLQVKNAARLSKHQTQKRQVETAENEKNEISKRSKASIERLKPITNWISVNYPDCYTKNRGKLKIQRTEELKKRFNENCSPNPEEVKAKLSALKVELEGFQDIPQSQLERIQKDKETEEKYKKEIGEIKKKFEDNKTKQLQSEQFIVSKSERLVDTINDKFSSMMAGLGYAGQIQLYKGEGALDFKHYGIRILVKFRAHESLQKLAPNVQSGGEKSVTTAIYMMALQELTKVPFRCVDEINQGMDEKNERAVWELLLNTARNHSAQYFYMAPKFPRQLQFDANMTVMVCYNGGAFKEPFDVGKFVKAAKKLRGD